MLPCRAMLAISLVFAAAVAAGPTPGTAPGGNVAGAPAAVLAVGEQPGADLSLLSRSVRDALAERNRAVLAPDEVRRRMTGRTSSASLSELDRAYLGAVAAQRATDLQGAARTLQVVIDDLDQLPESEDAAAQRTRALLRLAYVESALGRKAAAREVIERLMRADPLVRPDPALPAGLREARRPGPRRAPAPARSAPSR